VTSLLQEDEVCHGRADAVSPLVRRVVANNPGPYTYHGTCTYLVGRGRVAVIDPGPDDTAHIDALLGAIGPGERITHLVVTHTHGDHSPAARTLRDRTGAPIYGFGPQLRLHDPDQTRVVFGDPEADPDPSQPAPRPGGDRDFRPDVVLSHGDVIRDDGWSLEAVHTPGHATNHLCYLVVEDAVLCTGDHVMGWSTSVVSPPDGNMGDYLASLEKLLGRPQDRRYLPGHGPAVSDPHKLVRALLAHRQDRSQQILDQLAEGPATIAELVPRLYANVQKRLWAAAGSSVYAHLIHMEELGLVATEDGEPLRRAARFARVV
jgi:glyoxylase-like metal-dependent hydrolase (beta-lactamase superfamily II)